jgi:hypothetical protein
MADAVKTILLNLNVDTRQYIKNITESRIVVERLKQEQKLLKESLENIGDKGSASYKKLTKALVEKEAQLRAATTDLKAYEKGLDSVNRAQIEQQRAQEDALRSTYETRKEVTELNKVVREAKAVTEDTFGKFTSDQKKAAQAVVDTKNKLSSLQEQNAKLKTALASAGDTGSAAYKKVENALAQNEAAIRSTKNELKSYEKEFDNSIKQTQAAENSYESIYRRYVEAEKQLKLLKNTIKQNSDGTIELTDEYKAASAEVLKLKNGLLLFNDGIKDGRLNVGNYKQGFSDAIKETGLFESATKRVGNALTFTSSAFDAVGLGSDTFVQGIQAASNAVKSFSVWVGGDDKENPAVTLSDGMEVAGKTSLETSKSIEQLGTASTVATNKGVSGFRALRVALISTGIGAVLVIVGSLIAYFTRFQSGIDKLRVAGAALGAAFDVLVDTLGRVGKTIVDSFLNPIETIKNFSFDNLVNSTKQLGSAMAAAAAEGARLEQQAINLEKREIGLIVAQKERAIAADELRKISDNKTKSDLERIKAAEEAGKLEKKTIEENLAIEKQRLAILDQQLARTLKNSGEISREELRQRQELKAKVLELEDDAADKEKDIVVETSKIRKTLLAESINANIALLQNELKTKQLLNEETLELEREIARKERDAALQDTTLNAAQRLKIESDYQLRLLEIQESAKTKREELTRAAIDAELGIIIDGKTREVATEAESLRRKLDNVKGNSEEEVRLRSALVAESALKVAEINRQYAQKELDEINKENDRKADALIAAVEQGAKRQNDALAVSVSEGLITEQDAAQQSLLIEVAKQEALLKIQKQNYANRLLSEKLFYDNLQEEAKKQLDSGAINQETYNARINDIESKRKQASLATEQQFGAQIVQTQQNVDNAKLESTIKTNEKRRAIEEAQIAFEQEVLGSFAGLINAFGQLLAQDEKNRKKYADVIKAFSVAEVFINLQKEISGYWTGAAQDTAKTGIFGGIGAQILAGIKTAAAVIRAAASINTIKTQKFEAGGYTVDDAIRQYNPKFANDFNGGYIDRPTLWKNNSGGMNLGAEKGTEWVGANWQVRQAPSVFAKLEQWRRTGVRPFLDGGFTIQSVSQPLIDSFKGIEDAVARGYAKAPAPRVAVTEINEVQNRVAIVEAGGNL